MKKRLIIIFAALFLQVAFLMQLNAQNLFSEPQKGKTLYGFCVYDSYDFDKFGIVTFDMESPSTTTIKYRLQDGYRFDQASAAAFANDKYYIFVDNSTSFNPKSFDYVDLETGERTTIKTLEYNTPKFADITYDYSTSTMYGIQGDTKLVTVNLNNGDIQNIGTFNLPLDVKMLTIASSYDGELYGVTAEGKFVSINKQTANVTLIGNTNLILQGCTQSMEFDHKTGKLYWTGYKGHPDNQGFFAEVNVATGSTTIIGDFTPNAQIIGLYIPFDLYEDNAPAAVSNLTVTPATNGELKATLSWTNPTTTFAGQTLTQLSGIKIYCDNELITTITNASIGGAQTYTHTPTTSSLKTYKVEPYNSIGGGVVKSAKAFVGRDLPSAPTNAVLTKDGTKGVINWNAPSTGINGGWIDNASLKYKITRLPDQTVLSTNCTTTSFVDETITTQSGYSYKITSLTADGEGLYATTNTLVIGSGITPPYTCNFETEDELKTWTIIDANQDDVTWVKYSFTDKGVSFGGAIGDDWLISPSIYLEAGKDYKFMFSVGRSPSPDVVENIKVCIGQDATVAGQSIVLSDLPNFTSGVKSIKVNVQTSGEYNIGFYCYSPKSMTGITISDISLKEQGKTDLTAIRVVTDYQFAPLEVPMTYNIVVKNIGFEDVYNYNVELLDEDWSMLSSKDVTDVIRSGDSAVIKVEYAELYTKGSKVFFARVNAPEDAEWRNDVTEGELWIQFIDSYTVKGKIVDEKGMPIANASIRVSGLGKYSTTTLSDGTYEIHHVMVSDAAYKIEMSKHGFKNQTSNFNVTDQDIELDDVTMQVNPLRPNYLKVETQVESNTINWVDGLASQPLRYDSGIVGGAYGPTPPTVGLYAVVGVAYNYPVKLNSVIWTVDDYTGEHQTMNIVIFELDAFGKPTSNILGLYENIPNQDNIFDGSNNILWNTYTLPISIESPNGVLVSISCPKAFTTYIDNTHDTPNAEYPFKPNCNFFSDDFRTGQFRTLEDAFISANLFVRADAEPLFPSEATQQVVGYNVSRLKAGDESNQSKWTSLTTEPISSTSFTDNSWSTAEQGFYKYAVQTVYTDDRTSKYTISEQVAKNMKATITIIANLNTASNDIEGAFVSLQSTDQNNKTEYHGTLDATGKIIFNDVTKDNYSLAIHKVGFTPYINAINATATQNEFSFGPYTLQEEIALPYDLKVVNTSVDGEKELTWSVDKVISEDFERHQDFTINSAGTIGWNAFDGDNSYSTSLGDITFPNSGERMAYVIFNPSKTTPPCVGGDFGTLLAPHSGDKCIAFMASTVKQNNDFIISPELNFAADFDFNFFAISPLGAAYGQEQIKVGYSTTGTTPADFIWLHNDESISVPYDKWTLFKYTVPAAAKYVTINYVSEDQYLLLVDDIVIGNVPTNRLISCEIFLDDVSQGTTTDFKHKFTNITKENKTFGVRTVYESGKSEIVKIDIFPNSVDQNEQQAVRLYPNPVKNKLFIDGEYSNIEIYDINGKKVIEANNTREIDVNNLSNGIHTVRVYNQNSTKTYKIVVNK